MKTLISLLLLLVTLTAAPACGQAPTTAITGGTLVNPDGEAVEDAVILIEGERIAAVGTAGEVAVPEGAEVIDASGTWIIPGLIDGHVHFFQSGGLYTRPDVIDLREHVPYEEEELRKIDERLEDTFRRYLASGVTGVADVGGPFWNFEVRERARAAEQAPDVAVAGPLISTYQPPALTTDDPPIIEIETPEEARQLVQEQAEREADFIKIWYIVRQGQTPEQHLPIVEATAEEARRHGLPLAVHATQLATAKAAVRAGADILVHSVTDRPVDDEFIALLLENDVIYTPTLVVNERYGMTLTQQIALTRPEFELAQPEVVSTLFDLRAIPEDELPAGVVRRMQDPEPVTPSTTAMENLERLHAAGVTVAAGTDAGNIGTLHGPSIFRELELMQEAGLSPMDVLTTATRNGARLMGRSAEAGTIEAGKQADLVLLEADPREDIRNAAAIRQVMKSGRAYTQEELLDKTPADLVQQQVNAYNARDLEAFVATFHPEVRIYDYPDQLRLSGRDALRETYRELFDAAPALHADILGRIEQGPYVIDRERVTGLPDGVTIEATAIYEVREGRITEVRFLRE